jgi:hypothetical protein
VIFSIYPDDLELYLNVSTELMTLLKIKYLGISTITDDTAWIQKCGSLIEGVIKEHLPTLRNRSTKGIIFVLT